MLERNIQKRLYVIIVINDNYEPKKNWFKHLLLENTLTFEEDIEENLVKELFTPVEWVYLIIDQMQSEWPTYKDSEKQLVPSNENYDMSTKEFEKHIYINLARLRQKWKLKWFE
jgi:hypothetical protein